MVFALSFVTMMIAFGAFPVKVYAGNAFEGDFSIGESHKNRTPAMFELTQDRSVIGDQPGQQRDANRRVFLKCYLQYIIIGSIVLPIHFLFQIKTMLFLDITFWVVCVF